MRPLLLLVLLAGCATPQPGRQDLVLTDTQGRVAAWIEPSGKVYFKDKPGAVVVALVKSLSDTGAQLNNVRDNLAKATAKKEPKAEGMEKLSEKSACDTDLALASDPETPDDIRAILYRSAAKCRAKKQDEAFKRLMDRNDELLKHKLELDKAAIEALKSTPPPTPLPKPSLLREP